MDTRKAWSLLGVDPDLVFRRLSSIPPDKMANEAILLLEDASRRAKGLMSVLHPDKSGGDHDSFVEVQQAISVLTKDTEAFVRKASSSGSHTTMGLGSVIIKA